MRKTFVLSLLLAISSAAVGAAGGAVSFYEIKTKSLDGKPADLATYRGCHAHLQRWRNGSMCQSLFPAGTRQPSCRH